MKDALLAALAGADAIGLNFYHESPRCIDLETAEKISAVAQQRVQRVGLFVNAPAEEINRHHDTLKFDFIQLHGDEPPELLAELPEVPFLRAFRYGEGGIEPILEYLQACSRAPTAVLIDAQKEGMFGGTGEALDWESLASVKEKLGEMKLVLAGGLTPFNVEEAVAAVRPAAVDCATGVESRPGNKDPLLVRAFVNTAKKALQALADGDS